MESYCGFFSLCLIFILFICCVSLNQKFFILYVLYESAGGWFFLCFISWGRWHWVRVRTFENLLSECLCFMFWFFFCNMCTDVCVEYEIVLFVYVRFFGLWYFMNRELSFSFFFFWILPLQSICITHSGDKCENLNHDFGICLYTLYVNKSKTLIWIFRIR